MGIFENFEHGKADETGFSPKYDETIAEKLTETEREKFDALTELVLQMPKKRDGTVDEASLTSAERLILDQYRELEEKGKQEWRKTGSL